MRCGPPPKSRYIMLLVMDRTGRRTGIYTTAVCPGKSVSYSDLNPETLC